MSLYIKRNISWHIIPVASVSFRDGSAKLCRTTSAIWGLEEVSTVNSWAPKSMVWFRSTPQDASHKWRFRSGFPTKNGIILVVTIASWGLGGSSKVWCDWATKICSVSFNSAANGKLVHFGARLFLIPAILLGATLEFPNRQTKPPIYHDVHSELFGP